MAFNEPMASAAPLTRLATHEVFNQPPDFVGRNLFAVDPALREAVLREAGTDAAIPLLALGEVVGQDETRDLADQANRNAPDLVSFDRWGRRLDEVRFHPAYHALLRLAHEHRVAAVAWDGTEPNGHVSHAARLALFSEVEQGTMCPMSMTYAAVPVLRQAPSIAAIWEPKIAASIYDPELRPATEKPGVMLGMAMTEKQGGSDLRATTTHAEPDGGGAYRLTGHKWFCSAPMSDGFLTLAQSQKGLSCFLVPRVTPDGQRNAIQVMRLKDKLGNRSNASAEIEYHAAHAELVGEDGRGISTILAMVHHTRLDTMASSLGLMRMALTLATHHVRHRAAFGKSLREQPLMRRVLADLQLDYEAAVALTFRIARAFDENSDDDRAFARLAVAAGKFWLTKRTPAFVVECMECLGGSGYIEESGLPRLYREAPVNAIWEGSGNVIALDLVRTITRDPTSLAAIHQELDKARGAARSFDRRRDHMLETLVRVRSDESLARRAAHELAELVAAAILIRHAPAAVSDAFCETRLAGETEMPYGAGATSVGLSVLLERIGV
jgi:putative acyl-CoA dehydrogenase